MTNKNYFKVEKVEGGVNLTPIVKNEDIKNRILNNALELEKEFNLSEMIVDKWMLPVNDVKEFIKKRQKNLEVLYSIAKINELKPKHILAAIKFLRDDAGEKLI